MYPGSLCLCVETINLIFPLVAWRRAALLASQVGAHHMSVPIDSLVAALTALFTCVTGKVPRFRADGGSAAENLALQNIQVGRGRVWKGWSLARVGR
jgi:hypothetical protein